MNVIFVFIKKIAILLFKKKKRGSIIFVVGKSPMDIMEPILL